MYDYQSDSFLINNKLLTLLERNLCVWEEFGEGYSSGAGSLRGRQDYLSYNTMILRLKDDLNNKINPYYID